MTVLRFGRDGQDALAGTHESAPKMQPAGEGRALLGKRIKVMETEFNAPGLYPLEWDGIAGNGEETAPGMLLYRLTQSTDNNPVVRRMIKSK